MIEPPQSGFTGVVWESRQPDQLARDLGTGPGPIPMAEAGATWAHLASSFGAAAVEYESILVMLRGAWQSVSSATVHERISSLSDWLGGAAQAAAANAARAEQQAAANELARLTMPNIADIQLIQQAEQMLQQIGLGLGAPIQAIAAVTDTNADAAKAAAARVMRVYEAATDPLAVPWVQDKPPVLSSGAALTAERSTGKGSPLPMPESLPMMPALPANFDPAALAAAAPSPTAYIAPAYTESEVPQQVPQAVPVSAAEAAAPAPASAMPVTPMGGGGAPAAPVEDAHRAGIAVEGADVIGMDNGIVSAPAVLGGSSAAPAPPQTGTPQPGTPPPPDVAQPGAA
ncbi:PPE domain-containing protein [Nocardia alni]|uniref:PPE domain-containing protein n=1 Tax=Nocardia alni TaxID=2815723 RepID=UPI001C234A58|nr:PPE domain-containing protein [Nocardia alni]